MRHLYESCYRCVKALQRYSYLLNFFFHFVMPQPQTSTLLLGLYETHKHILKCVPNTSFNIRLVWFFICYFFAYPEKETVLTQMDFDRADLTLEWTCLLLLSCWKVSFHSWCKAFVASNKFSSSIWPTPFSLLKKISPQHESATTMFHCG